MALVSIEKISVKTFSKLASFSVVEDYLIAFFYVIILLIIVAAGFLLLMPKAAICKYFQSLIWSVGSDHNEE